MTVRELHTFTDAEVLLIEEALRIARDRWQDFADEMSRKDALAFSSSYELKAKDAGELAARINDSRTGADHRSEPSAWDLRAAYGRISRVLECKP